MILSTANPIFARAAQVSVTQCLADVTPSYSKGSKRADDADVARNHLLNPVALRAMLSFSPLAKPAEVVIRALSDGVRTTLRDAGKGQTGMETVRDVMRLVPQGKFDKDALDAWVSVRSHRTATLLAAEKAAVSDRLTLGDLAICDIRLRIAAAEEILAILADAESHLIVDGNGVQWDDETQARLKHAYSQVWGDYGYVYPVELKAEVLEFLMTAGLNPSSTEYPSGGVRYWLFDVGEWQGLHLNKAQDLETALAAIEEATVLMTKTLEQLESLLPKESLSSWEIYADLVEAISVMNEEYMERWQTAVTRYAEFFDDVNSAMGDMSKYITVNDEGEVKVASGFLDGLLKTRDKWANDNILLEGLSPTDALVWAELLGPLAYADGGNVKINLEPLDKLIEISEEHTKTWMSPQKFSAFQSALQIHQEKLQTNMQTMVQKYSTANSTFDNLIKVLSSTIASLLETDRSFLQI